MNKQSSAAVIRMCIDRCAEQNDDEWHAWRASVSCYSGLRNGSKERNMPAWMACEAARRIGLWLRGK